MGRQLRPDQFRVFFSSPSLATWRRRATSRSLSANRRPRGWQASCRLPAISTQSPGRATPQRPMNRRHTVGDHGGGPWAMDPAEQVAENLAGVFPASVAAGQDELVGALFCDPAQPPAGRVGPVVRAQDADQPAGHDRRRAFKTPAAAAAGCAVNERRKGLPALDSFQSGRVRGRPIRGPEPPCSVRCCRPNRLPPPPGNWRRGACRSCWVRTGTVSLPAVKRKVCSLGHCSIGTAVISAAVSMPTVSTGRSRRRSQEADWRSSALMTAKPWSASPEKGALSGGEGGGRGAGDRIAIEAKVLATNDFPASAAAAPQRHSSAAKDLAGILLFDPDSSLRSE